MPGAVLSKGRFHSDLVAGAGPDHLVEPCAFAVAGCLVEGPDPRLSPSDRRGQRPTPAADLVGEPVRQRQRTSNLLPQTAEGLPSWISCLFEVRGHGNQPREFLL